MIFEDGTGQKFVGTPREIIRMMKHIEWGDTPPLEVWKDRVTMRASMFGHDLEFHDAESFLHALERAGLGRIMPDFVQYDDINNAMSEKTYTKSHDENNSTY